MSSAKLRFREDLFNSPLDAARRYVYNRPMKTTKAYQRATRQLKVYCRCCPKKRDGKSDGLCAACRLVFWREATARYQKKKKKEAK